MALQFAHTMSPPQAHLFEAGFQTSKTTLGSPRNFGWWHIARGSQAPRSGSLFSALGPPRTKEQSQAVAASSVTFCLSTGGQKSMG